MDTYQQVRIQQATDKLVYLADMLAKETDPVCQAILEDDLKEARATLFTLTDL